MNDEKIIDKKVTNSRAYSRPWNRAANIIFFTALSSVAILACLLLSWDSHLLSWDSQTAFNCPQGLAWDGSFNKSLDSRYKTHFSTQYFVHSAIKRFSGALQIPTVSFDEMRGGPKGSAHQDINLHKPFLDFHAYLEHMYPFLHGSLERKVIHEYSLLYTWKGSNVTLKPGMLMAHIDVVPVDPQTINDWKYPPFSGIFNEEEGKIYGRGAMDTKMTLIAIMESIESLLEAGFQPRRTWYLSFGSDEEISGFNGIAYIVNYMKNELNVSQNGIEFVVDEGQSLITLSADNTTAPSTVALVGISEKGYMDFNISLKMKKGGHASLPPSHTAIGILSSIITDLESHPFPSLIEEYNPVIRQYQCIATHTSILTSLQKFALNHFSISLPFIYTWFSSDPVLKASMTTTQAADIISGGVKVNAIPTSAYAVINLRINPHESVNLTVTRLVKRIEPLVEKLGLDLDVFVHKSPDNFTYQFSSGSNSFIGSVSLEFDAIDPAPISPINSTSFSTLSSVIRHVFNETTVVAPSLMVANTDTKFVWDLTENIFRYFCSCS